MNTTNLTVEAIVAALNAKKDGDEWAARCVLPENHPHGDANPSLVISRGNNGKPLVHCRSGCDQQKVWAAVVAKATGKTVELKQPKEEFKGNQAQVDLLHKQLATSPEAQAWMSKCGISADVADELQLGASERVYFKKKLKDYSAAVVTPHYDLSGSTLIGLKARAVPAKDFDQEPGSSIDGLFAAALLDPLSKEVVILEGDKDIAIALSHGFNATGILSAQSKLSKEDIALLAQYKRVFLIGDQDIHGIEAMDRIEKQLSPEKVVRVRLQVNDIGALYEENPADFKNQLRAALRHAAVTRKVFDWDDLLVEDEIVNQQGTSLKYAVDQIIPLRRVTMIFGQEKSMKSLLVLYIGKCVANGVRFLDTYGTTKMPVLYLDAEHGVVGEYLSWMQNLGDDPIHFRTLETGIPALDDPSLLKICETMKPLIVVDSLHKFNTSGGSSWASFNMEPIMAKLQRLTTLGATVIIIHHAVRDNAARYADSFAIGANVDFMYAVVADPPQPNGVRKLTMIGKPSRGAMPPTLKLIAFPHMKELGKFALDGDPVKTDKELVYDFIGANPHSNTRTIMKGVPINHNRVDAILKAGEKDGEFVVTEGDRKAKHYDLKTTVPDLRERSNDDSVFPEAGTVEEQFDYETAK
jgi:hypothetical protein